jgi:hypothetical protein
VIIKKENKMNKYVAEFANRQDPLRFVAPNDDDARAYVKLHASRKDEGKLQTLYEDNDPELREVEVS